MRSLPTITIFLCLVATSLTAQVTYHITLNGNVYFPQAAAAKGSYPILGYDKDLEPKVLVGGFGAGGSVQKRTGRVLLKGDVNISRHVYWEAIAFNDGLGFSTGDAQFRTSDLVLNLIPTMSYPIGKFSFGTGLGTSLMLVSRSKTPYYPGMPSKLLDNKFYRFLTPIVPIDLSFTNPNTQYTIRFEQSLGSRYKGDMGDAIRERFLVMTFQVAFKLK